MKLHLLFTGVLVAVLLVSPATAQSAQRASELKTQGDALVHELRYREAIASYDAAYAISHDPAILYNRGRAYDALGEAPQALDEFEEFVRVAPTELKAKVPRLDELLAATRARVATVLVHCSVDGATLFVRNRHEGTTPLATPLRFRTGSALIEVQAPGYRPFREDVQLTAGAPMTIEVTLMAKDAGMPPPPPPAHPTSDSHGNNAWKWGAYTAGGLGIAAVASGATFGVLAIARQISADGSCPEKGCDPAGSRLISDARTFATISTVSFVVGGVGIVTSAILFLWKPGASRNEARITPIIGPLFGGVQGTF